ncbi:MAG: nucleotidyltransferase family protein [Paracoccaceae bacterium]
MIAVILLAAGASRRMQGRDKLLENIGGAPLLHRTACAAVQSKVSKVHVILPPDHGNRKTALRGLDVNIVEAKNWQKGMAASIRAGMAALPQDCIAVIIALADMPEVTLLYFNRLIAGYSPQQGHEICRAVAQDGTHGHPVLFGRRFFERLSNLKGDQGAKEILKTVPGRINFISMPGQGAIVDLDTPLALDNWRKTQ